MERIRNCIDGAFVDAADGATLETLEPATGAPHATLPASGAADVAAAVAAAKRAFPAWAATPAAERSAVMMRVAARLERDLERLALDESTDTGKPVHVARAVDIPRAAANFRFFAGAILHDQSEFHDTDGRALNYTLRRPRGVAACISPWNLPLYLFTWKIAPALASGNTVVGKPSEITPLTAFRLAEICVEEGMPPGVLNLVHGRGPEAGQPLVEHPDVSAFSFTGGTATGRVLGRIAGERFLPASLELGGKNATVVFADADFDLAVRESVRAAFSNQGQICLCGSRVLVEASLYDRFLEAFLDRVRALRVGDPRDPATDQGAVVSAAHRDKVLSYVDLARTEGGTLALGGGTPAELPGRCRNGFFVEPTVITGLAPTCRTMQEEIFGPVVTVTPFADEAEALAMANGTPYGLAMGLWTRDLDRAHRVAAELESGIVWVNCWMLRDLRTPFGGVKQSGLGREGGWEALRFFTEPRNVCVRLDAREDSR